MANPVGTERAVEQAVGQDWSFWSALAASWHKVLILILVCAFIIYAIYYMRRRFPIVREFLQFLRERKLWWMTPIVVVFILLAVLIVTMEHSAIAPFIYALF